MIALLLVGFFIICLIWMRLSHWFHQHLKEDGKLIIADFTKTEANHHGFDLAELENKLIEHGFSSVNSQILYSAEDLFQGNHSEFFLTVAQKSLA
ncbi:methyltransferase small domain superfamily [Streptococcus pneumoniae]|nr:methyltransferase small domain superfamily [Streptococcus pneumoniae]